MGGLLASLDNREIALLCWITAALIWALFKPAVRKSLSRVLKAFSAKPILVCLSLMSVYICLEVVVLERVGVWTETQLKATVIWGVTTACVMLFNVNAISEDEHYFRKALRENFKLSVLIDFFVNFHVLPLVAEIVLIPIAGLLGGMIAYCDTDEEKFGVTQHFLNSVLFTLGVGLLVYATWKTSKSIDGVASLEILRNLAVPILLSILHLPFIFFVSAYAAYENVFVRLQFVVRDAALHRYTKQQLLFRVRFNLPVLRTWLKSAWQTEFRTRQDVLASINEAVAQYARE